MSISEPVKQYILKTNMATLFNDMAADTLQAMPDDMIGFMIEWLKKKKAGTVGEESLKQKMINAKLSQSFISAYLQCYKDLVAGKTGIIPENSIQPVTELPEFERLPPKIDAELLGQTVVLKLNGGLGTSMGLEKAKSLLPVKGNDTFLDFIAKQVIALRAKYNFPLKFMLMNSFSTSDDTKKFLSKYHELANDPSIELLQNKAPKVDANTLMPASWPKNPELEWCPPGHGDLYAALAGSGKLKSLLDQGIKYAFVSNSDNLGATLDLNILTYFAELDVPMLMEVCRRTEADKKGGHLAKDKNGLLLRESAQCSKEDEPAFQDINKHKFFNTNNLWLNLHHLANALEKFHGVIPLPLIRNSKTVDPRDPSSTAVYQLETAMGAAIASLSGSQALVVPRTRFAPVKTCGDLFLLKSDVYKVTEDWRLVMSEEISQAPIVDLDSKLYKMVDQLDQLLPSNVPSLLKCKRLKIKGPIQFGDQCVLEGDVDISNTSSDKKSVNGHVTGKVVNCSEQQFITKHNIVYHKT